MTTFDEILPLTIDVLECNRTCVEALDWMLVNRDLNGKVRLILPEVTATHQALKVQLEALAQTLAEQLGVHAYPPESMLLYEASLQEACEGASSYLIEGFERVRLVDRLTVEGHWNRIAPETQGVPRIVFFSIKGGVGRSTALAASAWSLAQAGKRVLVLDLDLESPGLSSALLPPERQPRYGITDWLVEDLVGNAEMLLDSMFATSVLSHDGEIYVVPAHGLLPGEYVSKLGRVWMSKIRSDGTREPWTERLERLLQALGQRIRPDIVLIDSRSGIDEVASTCITDMGANLILLFALEGGQTWNGYRMLFEHWQRAHVAQEIRERLRVVGAMVPDLDGVAYLQDLREHAYEVFVETLYDEIAPPDSTAIGPSPEGDGKWRVAELVEGWSFDEADEGAPHYPWVVNWHRSFAGLRSLQGRLSIMGRQEVNLIFGPLLDGVSAVASLGKQS